jgi:transposase-like protein
MAKAQAQRRPQAIDRSLAGAPIEDICRELAGSKSWLYTWRDRYRATDPAWSEEQSRSPRTTPTKTPQRLAHVVVALRQTLASHGKGCSAAAIQQALAQQGSEPVPAQRTIYRSLHRSAKEVT